MIITLPITLGKVNENGLRDVTVNDGAQNQWTIETTQEKIDEFVAQRKELSKDIMNKRLINAMIGVAAGAAVIGIVAAAGKARISWAALIAGIWGGGVSGFVARDIFFDRKDKQKYNKLVANLEIKS